MPNVPTQAFMGLLWDISRVASEKRQAAVKEKIAFGFVSTAFCTSNLPFAHSPNSFVYCPRLEAGVSQLRNRLSSRAISLILRL